MQIVICDLCFKNNQGYEPAVDIIPAFTTLKERFRFDECGVCQSHLEELQASFPFTASRRYERQTKSKDEAVTPKAKAKAKAKKVAKSVAKSVAKRLTKIPKHVGAATESISGEKLYTTKEAMQMAGLSPKGANYYIETGRLVPSSSDGNRYLFSQSAVDAFLASRASKETATGDKLMDVKEAMQYTGLPDASFKYYLRLRRIQPEAKQGGRRFFAKSTLDRFLAERSAPATSGPRA